MKKSKPKQYFKMQCTQTTTYGFYVVEAFVKALMTNMELRDEVVKYIDKRLKIGKK